MKTLIAAAGALVIVSAPAFAVTKEEKLHLDLNAEVNALHARALSSDIAVAPEEEDLSAVPLPAAGWMLLAGLGGLVAMRRRTRA